MKNKKRRFKQKRLWHLACLTIDRSKAQPTFICSAFQMHPEIRQQLTGQAKGAIMDGLNLTIIKKLCFKLPTLAGTYF